MQLKQIAVLEAAFNPPHLGHQDILQQISREFDEIVLIPRYQISHQVAMADFSDRLLMTKALVELFNFWQQQAGCRSVVIKVSDIARQIARQQQSVNAGCLLATLDKSYAEKSVCAEFTWIENVDSSAFHLHKTRLEESWYIDAELQHTELSRIELKQRCKILPIRKKQPIKSAEIRALIRDFSRPQAMFVSRFKNYLNTTIANYIYRRKLYGA
ncbi:adenylyltransferase/cytidyltransferase family protein [Aliikangiella maris]|uniref:Adenylyltransferase/cytidyltransferase family protein n=2 Tax=Aliikangiella maris TaxID=3162458 RepID=A0ABV2BRQ8_9GAMM